MHFQRLSCWGNATYLVALAERNFSGFYHGIPHSCLAMLGSQSHYCISDCIFRQDKGQAYFQRLEYIYALRLLLKEYNFSSQPWDFTTKRPFPSWEDPDQTLKQKRGYTISPFLSIRFTRFLLRVFR